MADTKKTLSTIKKGADGSLLLTITIPTDKIAVVREQVIQDAVKQTTLPGFRQGKAPRELVEKSLDSEKVREEILKKALPEAYIAAVEEHKIRPIINPKIHVEKVEDNVDWTFTAETCEIPEIDLKNYKEKVKELTAKSKIVIPGKEVKAPSFEEIMDVVLKTSSIQVPAILVEGEIERQLGQLLGEIKKLGLTLDQYLSSTNKTVDDLRNEYKVKAENDIKLEFALQKIADVEKITVEQKELDEALEKAKDPSERKQLEANMYLLANILKQQKTLDFIKNL